MKQKLLNIVMVVASMAIVALIMGNKASSLRDENGRLTMELSKANAAATETAAQGAQADGEIERLKQDNAELIKLRGEVAALRKEKDAWGKQTAANQQAAAAAAARGGAAQLRAADDAKDSAFMQNILHAAPAGRGAELGKLRRKILNGEKLTEAEQAVAFNVSSLTANLEKSPADFAAFQTTFVGSVLGWNDGDPRAAQLQELINRAATVANERGFNYHAPSENSAAWNEQQKMLNQRATGAAQAMLTPDERAVFDSAFIGILGVDAGMGRTTPK